MKKTYKIIIPIIAVALIIGGYVYYKLFVEFLGESLATVGTRRFNFGEYYAIKMQDEGYYTVWQYIETENKWYVYSDKCVAPSNLLITWWQFFRVTGTPPRCFSWLW